ncbi:Uncharacterized protein PHSC3_002009 [Chlamydiales bacterium STE3]|nr:Uncharacterized protein PHSC3_002009 [Chlamydiales bacterium STE3]
MNAKTSVIFLKVHTNGEKLAAISTALQNVVAQKKKILILVPSLEAADYLDKYLWQSADENFLPHIKTNKKTKEIIAITLTHENHNQADVLLNLNPTISSITAEFATVYDFEDFTSTDKARLSETRKLAYQKL